MSAEPIAACAGQWRLFDSTNRADHYAAAQICAGCPIRLQCATDLEQRRRNSSDGASAFRPQGTWAGRLYGSPRPTPDCGTESGYQYHRRQLHEPPCDPCKEARAIADRERRTRKAAAA